MGNKNLYIYNEQSKIFLWELESFFTNCENCPIFYIEDLINDSALILEKLDKENIYFNSIYFLSKLSNGEIPQWWGKSSLKKLIDSISDKIKSSLKNVKSLKNKTILINYYILIELFKSFKSIYKKALTN